MAFDPSTLDDHVRERLENEPVIWLTTVSPTGRPSPRPVWYLWEDGKIYVRSQPDTAKMHHLAANPEVALNLNASSSGGDVVILHGRAVIEDSTPPSVWGRMVEKYRDGIASLGSTPERFSEDYSEAIRIDPESLATW